MGNNENIISIIELAQYHRFFWQQDKGLKTCEMYFPLELNVMLEEMTGSNDGSLKIEHAEVDGHGFCGLGTERCATTSRQPPGQESRHTVLHERHYRNHELSHEL